MELTVPSWFNLTGESNQILFHAQRQRQWLSYRPWLPLKPLSLPSDDIHTDIADFTKQLEEAVKILKGMSGAGCLPDLESFAGLITAMCTFRRTVDAVELVKQMVQKARLTPRQGTVMKVVATLRANREIWKAVELIEFLERKGNPVGFESYELVVEGCLECCEYILAGKVVIAMTERGFIPYIRVRQKVVEGLVNVNELKLAYSVRERLAELGS